MAPSKNDQNRREEVRGGEKMSTVDSRFEAIVKVERTELERDIEREFEQEFRNDDGQFILERNELQNYGNPIIKFLIGQIATLRAEFYLMKKRKE